MEIGRIKVMYKKAMNKVVVFLMTVYLMGCAHTINFNKSMNTAEFENFKKSLIGYKINSFFGLGGDEIVAIEKVLKIFDEYHIKVKLDNGKSIWLDLETKQPRWKPKTACGKEITNVGNFKQFKIDKSYYGHFFDEKRLEIEIEGKYIGYINRNKKLFTTSSGKIIKDVDKSSLTEINGKEYVRVLTEDDQWVWIDIDSMDITDLITLGETFEPIKDRNGNLIPWEINGEKYTMISLKNDKIRLNISQKTGDILRDASGEIIRWFDIFNIVEIEGKKYIMVAYNDTNFFQGFKVGWMNIETKEKKDLRTASGEKIFGAGYIKEHNGKDCLWVALEFKYGWMDLKTKEVEYTSTKIFIFRDGPIETINKERFVSTFGEEGRGGSWMNLKTRKLLKTASGKIISLISHVSNGVAHVELEDGEEVCIDEKSKEEIKC